MSMDADFFNNAVALLPVMILTKVVDRHRRQANAEQTTARQICVHRWFVGVSILGILLAMLGAAIADWRSWTSWAVVVCLVLSSTLLVAQLVAQEKV
jgi:hypothetical protein